MTTEERLRQFYPFDEDVVAQVSEVADRQRAQSFDSLTQEYRIGTRPHLSWPMHDGNAIQYWHIDPERQSDIDRSKIRVYHAPMANPANANMAMRAIRLYAADPSVPLMVVGNPTGVRRGGAKVVKSERESLRHGDFSALARPLLAHLTHNNVERIETVGFSFGADLAAETAAVAHEYGVTVQKGVWMEPASVAMRGGVHLMKDFWRSGSELDRYVEASDSKALIEARQQDAREISFVNWAFGLTTPTNRAIARGIARGVFAKRVQQALDVEPLLATTVAWGSHSELSTPVKLNLLMQKMQKTYGDRLNAMELKGMHHAGGDDIDLHAAIVLQGLKDATA